MSDNVHQINLIQGKSSLSPELISVVHKMKVLGIGSTVGLLFITAGILGFSFFMSQTLNALQTQKTQLTESLRILSTREGLYRSLKKHAGVTATILKQQAPWHTVLEAVERIAPPPVLTAIAVSERQEVVTSYHATSVEESITALENLTQILLENKVKNPMLVSYTLVENGTVRFTLSFSPIF